jgi:hypothetical protein
MDERRPFPFRLFFWSVVLVAVGAGSIYLAYEFLVKPQRDLQNQILEQKVTILELEQEKQRLETYLKLLKHIERRARVEVLRQAPDRNGVLFTTIRFTEIDKAGKPVSASREFTLPGREVYFDTLIIKFEDHFVEVGDAFKGHALMLFRRVFSSVMKPEEGFIIDIEGQAPEAYAEQKAPSQFERDLWKRFWDLANNEDLARKQGVRAIHGDAPYTRLEPDRVYEVSLRSTGEMVITPGTRLPAAAQPASQ